MPSSAQRVIMHVDMDAFYVSVELRNRPELRGTPVVVGGSPRGVVLSASYEARAFGVRSGISSTQARRLAPKATFIGPDFDAYTAVSKAIVAVFRSVSSVVEAASIDEAYLDVTGSVRMFGAPSAIGEHLRAVVADEQQITCSVGIGPNKFIAKIASRQAKPDGLIEVRSDGVVGFLHPLPVQAMYGVGPATTEKLNRLGLFTVADVAHTPRGTLRRAFGPHAGVGLHHLAWGRDGQRVVNSEPERSVGSQETFGRDTDDPSVVHRELLRMADRTASRMRKAGLVGRTVTLSVRFADFTELTRSATLPIGDRRHRGDLRRGGRPVRAPRSGPGARTEGRCAGGGSPRRRPRVPAATADRPGARLAGGGAGGRRSRRPLRSGGRTAGDLDPSALVVLRGAPARQPMRGA